jgi:hypothetical protein
MNPAVGVIQLEARPGQMPAANPFLEITARRLHDKEQFFLPVIP